ncbi:S16 family serine protease [Candidatus Xianfuyuplasma coldseepsis]|uniref:Lon proteolytic domain-containing protein n=1 Tax=Candidatus Xianfuyuplasma coldseepsis TaxID=2782163 RepID=A0A7L7KTX8_9MOLU|nr:S16 family serine protease [Xianfuyuplasma coldseepsis]QMS85879.1 hypothetical protein G4Z02_09005 [Xianfuyuplasma coldseepsis]
MKQTFLQYRTTFFVLIGVTIISLFVSLFPLELKLTAPGLNSEVGDFITIEEAYPVEGSLHTTSVISLDRVTLLQYLVGEFENKVDIEEYPEYYDTIDVSDLTITGSLYHDDSLVKSLIVGISRTNHTIDYETNTMVYLTYNYLDADTIEIGDIVLSVNGSTDINTAIQEVACNATGEFVVLRDDQELTYTITKHQLDDYCAFGLFVRDFSEILTTDVQYTIHQSHVGGSSGGLLQTLYVYNALTPNDITGGLKIAGTGTIRVDGSVGAIGGVRQKIITASMNNIDVFFVPHLSDSENDNYVVAMKTFEELSSNMIIVPVTSFDDALDYLEGRFGGAYDE